MHKGPAGALLGRALSRGQGPHLAPGMCGQASEPPLRRMCQMAVPKSLPLPSSASPATKFHVLCGPEGGAGWKGEEGTDAALC